ncbi:MAG: low molecular weight phosphotyrosine protein phosphatase [Cyanobacteria bacterium]|nr:low molecular weight phosphotyrosine protein phosphatase [Cyanobacteriota bacterium]
MKKRVLFVCLGNICRSPAAEGVFLHLLDQSQAGERFVVDSAGTGGWHVGKAPDARMCAAASRRGIHLVSKARQLELADFNSFDYILTMDASNLSQVQDLAQKAGGSGGARIEPLLRYCTSFDLSEVPDPYYGGAEGFEHVLDLLEDACSGLLQALDA